MRDEPQDLRHYLADKLLEECLWALNETGSFVYHTHVRPEDWTPDFKSERRTSYELAARIEEYFRRGT